MNQTLTNSLPSVAAVGIGLCGNDTCPSCMGQVSTAAAHCPHCGFASDTVSASPQIPEGMILRGTSKVPARVKLNLSIDRTSSSAPFTSGIFKLVEGITTEVTTRVASLDLTTFSHGDLACGQDCIQLGSNATPEEALRDIQALTFEGGGDVEEDHLAAADELLKRGSFGGTNPEDRPFVLLITTDGSHAATRSAQAIGADYLARGVNLILVGSSDDATGLPVCRRLRQLVEAARGQFIPISNAPTPSEIQSVASLVGRSVIASSAGTRTLPSGTLPATPP